MVFGTVATINQGLPTVASALAIPGPPSDPAYNLGGGTRIPSDISDGTSNTIIWMDKLAFCSGGGTNGGTVWAEPGNPAVLGPTFMALVPPFGTTIAPATTPLPIYGSAVTGQPQVAGISSPASCNFALPSSGHTGVLQVCMADGSVRSVDQGISLPTFSLALIPNDKLPMGPDW